MVYKMYSIKDECIGFGIPFALENDGVAIRTFENAYHVNNSMYATKPNDFSLYCVGTFDNKTGDVNPILPFRVCEASEFVER